MTDKITGLEQAITRLHERLQSAVRALYTLHAAGNDEAANIALSRIEVLNTRIAELNALLDTYEAEDAQRAANEAAAAAPIGLTLTELLVAGGSPEVTGPVVYPAEEGLAPMTIEVWDGPIAPPPMDDEETSAPKYFGWAMAASVLLFLIVAFVAFGPLVSQFQRTAATAVVLNAVPAEVTKAPVTDAAVDEALSEELTEVIISATPVEEPVVVKTIEPTTVTYTVVKGDTLWSIAQAHLGSGNLWVKVWSENSQLISDPDLIYPGQVVQITTVTTGVSTP